MLDTIETKLGVKRDAQGVPQKLSEQHGPDPLLTMGYPQLRDIMSYLLDTTATLWAFLEVFPDATNAFRQDDFPTKLVTLCFFNTGCN